MSCELQRQHFTNEAHERDGVLLSLAHEIFSAANACERTDDHLADVAVILVW